MNTEPTPTLAAVDQPRLVRPLPEYTYEDGEGPKCPFCGTVYTADDPMYYDEQGFEDDCDECGNTICVEPEISVSWRTRPIRWANTNDMPHPSA